MDLAAFRESLRQIDLDALSDWEAQLARAFLALFEAHLELHDRTQAVEALLAEAEAEIRRLKGLPEPPDRSGASGSGTAGEGRKPRRDLSSEKERQRRAPKTDRRKGPQRKRNSTLAPVEFVDIDLTEAEKAALPPDAVANGYRRVRKQELRIERRVVEFRLRRYYSRSLGKTFDAQLPAGWEGDHGPGVGALLVLLNHQMNVGQELIHTFLQAFGIVISAGTVCNKGVDSAEIFAAERQEVLRAGLESSPWQQTDATPTKVNGQAETCHVVGNPTFTHLHTGPDHDRDSVVRLLRAGEPDRYLLDAETLAWLRHLGWSERRLTALQPYCEPFLRSRAVLAAKVRGLVSEWSPQDQAEFWSAALLMGWRYDPAVPTIQSLLSDDHSIYLGVTVEQMLCWIHELRHFKRLQPPFAIYQGEVERVLGEAWDFYRELEDYRRAPHPGLAAGLSQKFDVVFGHTVRYGPLQARLKLTAAKKERLLRVLKHPELPLHNNESELAARTRVRRRDVSFGPRSRAGATAWDTFQGLATTTAKLGVHFYEYVYDRLTRAGRVPRLADLVRAKARELRLGWTWVVPSPHPIE